MAAACALEEAIHLASQALDAAAFGRLLFADVEHRQPLFVERQDLPGALPDAHLSFAGRTDAVIQRHRPAGDGLELIEARLADAPGFGAGFRLDAPPFFDQGVQPPGAEIGRVVLLVALHRGGDPAVEPFQDFHRLVLAVAAQADDHRHVNLSFQESLDEPPRRVELLLAGYAGAGAEIAVNRPGGHDDFGRAVDLAGRGIAAGVHKGRQFVALAQHGVHAHHRAAAARAVKADVAFALLKAFGHLDKVKGSAIVVGFDGVGDFLQFGRRAVVFTGDLDAQVGMAKDAVIVHGDAAIGGHDRAVGELHQGVDLGGAGVVLPGQAVEAGQHAAQFQLQFAADAGLAHQVPRLKIEQARAHVHVQPRHLVRVGGGDLFDAGPADAGKEDHRLLGRVVNDDAGIEFAGDLDPLLDQHLLYGEILDLHAQHVAGGLFGLGGVAGLFDAAQPGPACDPGLGLDHHLAAQLLGDAPRLLRRPRHAALGDGDFEFFQ